MNKIIEEKLRKIEQENNVEIILAAEAGSRAWGFSSEDSDYDVRFIYKRKLQDYLSIKVRSDSDKIDCKDVDQTYDMSGHELKNVLRFILRSNISILEWLNSPIRHISSDLADELKLLSEEYFEPNRAIMHYFSMAQQHYDRFFNTGDAENPSIPLKKYFYVIKALLGAQYVLDMKKMSPVNLEELVNIYFTDTLKDSFLELLGRKRKSRLEDGPKIPVLDDYITEHLQRIQKLIPEIKFEPEKDKPVDKLDAFFRRAINLD